MIEQNKQYPHILTSEFDIDLDAKIVSPELAKQLYPNFVRTHQPTTDTSLAAQVKRQFTNGRARHISDGIYQLTLSKNRSIMDKPELDQELTVLKLKPDQIQYISQNHHNITIQIRPSSYAIKKWRQSVQNS